jgi:hypothetical protein
MAYTAPDAAALKVRFPAFASVADETVDYWLEDARLTVTDAWDEADRAVAEMLLAAHNMAMQGLGTAGGAVANLAAMGVTDFKSASMSVSFDAASVRTSKGSGYDATTYGQQFKVYLRRNVGGPRLVSACA